MSADTNDVFQSSGNMFKKSVLLVDDQLTWQELLKEILARNNEFEVVCASNLEEALSYIRSGKFTFHVVVIDVILDEKDPKNEDGFLLLEELSKLKYPARAVVLDHPEDPIGRFKKALGLKALDYFDKASPDKHFPEQQFLESVKEAAQQAGVVDVFVIMPFDQKYWNFYDSAIKATFKNMGPLCQRSDEIFHSSVIMKDILRYVRYANFIVADLSEKNPNVLFEIGLAHALQKPVILLARDLKRDVPAILQDNVQVFDYDVTLSGVDKIGEHLGNAARKIQIGQSPIILEKLEINPDDTLCLGIVPQYRSDKSDAYALIIKFVAEKSVKMKARRLEEITGPGSVIDQAWEYVNRARIVVADLTDQDSRVYYWSGVAYGLEKDIVTLAKKEEKIPFDLRGIYRLEYSMDFEEGLDARENLKNAMNELLNKKSVAENSKADSTNNKSKVENKPPLENIPSGDNMRKTSNVKVFLNHATEDKTLVKQLYSELKKYPWIEPWIDEEELLPGQELDIEIDKAMKESDAVLVCISKTSINKKGYVQAEIRKAEEQQKFRPAGTIYMIPVLLEPCQDQVPVNFQKYLWVDISQPGKIDLIIKSLATLK